MVGAQSGRGWTSEHSESRWYSSRCGIWARDGTGKGASLPRSCVGSWPPLLCWRLAVLRDIWRENVVGGQEAEICRECTLPGASFDHHPSWFPPGLLACSFTFRRCSWITPPLSPSVHSTYPLGIFEMSYDFFLPFCCIHVKCRCYIHTHACSFFLK